MADENQNEQGSTTQQVNELDVLKARAKVLGIEFSNNIGVEALAAKIKDKLEPATSASVAPPASMASAPITPAPVPAPAPVAAKPVEPASQPAPVNALKLGAELQNDTIPAVPKAPEPVVADPEPVAEAPVRVLSLREYMMKEQLKLIRVRITNMDPKKKDLPGEIFTISNEYLGNVRKYVPYGEASDEGYHLPYCIFKELDDRKFLSISVIKDKKNNNNLRTVTRWAKEFAFEVLEPLTQHELNQLAAAQAAAGSLDAEL